MCGWTSASLVFLQSDTAQSGRHSLRLTSGGRGVLASVHICRVCTLSPSLGVQKSLWVQRGKQRPLRDAHRPKRGGRTAGGHRERSGRDRGRRRRGREPRGRWGASEECDVVAVWTRAGAQDDVGLRRSERRVEARVFTRHVLRRHRRTGGNRAAAPFLTLPPRRAGRQRFGSVKSVSSNHTGCFLSNTPSCKSWGKAAIVHDDIKATLNHKEKAK